MALTRVVHCIQISWHGESQIGYSISKLIPICLIEDILGADATKFGF